MMARTNIKSKDNGLKVNEVELLSADEIAKDETILTPMSSMLDRIKDTKHITSE